MIHPEKTEWIPTKRHSHSKRSTSVKAFEVSAKTGEGVSESIDSLVQVIATSIEAGNFSSLLPCPLSSAAHELKPSVTSVPIAHADTADFFKAESYFEVLSVSDKLQNFGDDFRFLRFTGNGRSAETPQAEF
jgi:hypothetical protein